MSDNDSKQIIIRKKVNKIVQAGHHGGAWKVAYADFVTAMMAFFMVMWLMGTDEETKKAIEQYFQGQTTGEKSLTGSSSVNMGEGSRKLDGGQGRFNETDSAKTSYSTPVYLEEEAVIKDLASYYDGSGFNADTDQALVKLNVPQRIIFEFGSVEVPQDEDTQSILRKLADIFLQHDGVIFIEGFPDKGQDWPLSFGRAMAIRRHLVRVGNVPPNKLIPVAGFEMINNDLDMPVNDHSKSSAKFILKRIRN